MYIVTIANQKGGVGKTTTCAAFAEGLTQRGYKVLCVDADPQANLTDLLQSDSGVTLYDVITGGADVQAAIQETRHGDLLRGDARLTQKGLLTGKGEVFLLRRILRSLPAKYDVVIIDAPPSLGALTISALVAADGVIIPARADKFSLAGVQELFAETIMRTVKPMNPELTVLGVLITQYNGRTTLNRGMLDAFAQQAEIYLTRVLMPPIRRTVAVEEAQFTGDVLGSSSTAAQDYNEIISQLPKLFNL